MRTGSITGSVTGLVAEPERHTRTSAKEGMNRLTGSFNSKTPCS
jgi:hypothetical protein